MKLNPSILFAALMGAAVAAPEPPGGGAAGRIPDWLDLDGDGVISEEERQAFAQSRREASQGMHFKWDTNGDGVVDEEERQAGVDALRNQVQTRRTDLFLDAAGEDEVLDREEFGTIHPVSNLPEFVADRLFGLLDADEDGSVTLDEFLGALEGPKPPGPPDPPNGDPQGPPDGLPPDQP
jgi:Ca2+-binding EF-hand superfamily protein